MAELELGIAGALNITDKMETLAEDLQANRVNALWAEKAYPSLERSRVVVRGSHASQRANWWSGLGRFPS